MNRTSQRALATVAAFGLLLSPLTVLAQTTPAPAPQSAPRKLISPVRGEATIEITAPATKVQGNDVVTTIMVKNTSSAPIAGFRVEENYYDRGGQPIGGDIYRHKNPLMPNEVIQVVLRTPRRTGMGDNRYNFSHANGTIPKPKVVPKLVATPPTT